ncbi:MAG: PHP domain-containing protein [Clostridia bacterium]|nr:PHP domain-containing protein [Clostridia bacterium]
MLGGLYLTETHCHTAAGSACGKVEPEFQVDHFKSLGVDTLFITEHFPIGVRKFGMLGSTFEERVEKMLTGFRRAKARGDEVGLRVLFGFEFGYKGADTLTYGLGPEFLLAHPEIEGMDPVDYAVLAHDAGGFLVHAHPYREAGYIKMIRLFPRSVDAVEVFNANRTDLANDMAAAYAVAYGLPASAGSDDHAGPQTRYGGLLTEKPVETAADLAEAIRGGAAKIYRSDL